MTFQRRARSSQNAIKALLCIVALAVGSTAFADKTSSLETSSNAPLNLDTPLEIIAATPAGLEALQTHLPKLINGPYWTRVKNKSLNELKVDMGPMYPQSRVDLVESALKSASPESPPTGGALSD